MSTSYSRQRVRGTDIDFERIVEEPFRAILLHSPGRKPWVIIVNTFIEPQRGGTTERINSNACVGSAAPTELLIFVSPVYPGFHIGLCPHSTLGYAGVSCLKALVISLNFDAVVLLGEADVDENKLPLCRGRDI